MLKRTVGSYVGKLDINRRSPLSTRATGKIKNKGGYQAWRAASVLPAQRQLPIADPLTAAGSHWLGIGVLIYQKAARQLANDNRNVPRNPDEGLGPAWFESSCARTHNYLYR